jgi:hypothetical protein
MDAENNDYMPAHAKKNCFFECIYISVAHPLFNFAIIVLILANIIVLA